MGITLRQADSTIHVVGVSYPDFYYRFTTHAETLMWQRPIDGLVWGEGPKIHLGPDGVPWAAMHSEPGGGASEVQLVRFGEDTSQTVYWPFRGERHQWYVYDFGIDAAYNFHFILANDTAIVAYARLDSSRQLQEWRTFGQTGYVFATIQVDPAGNCGFAWYHSISGVHWAYRLTDGTWTHPPTVIDPLTHASSFSIVKMDSERFAFTAQGDRQGGFLQLRLYTYGFPPDAASRPRTGAPLVSLTAYPNPFVSTLTVRLPASTAGSVILYDVLGRFVWSQPICDGQRIVRLSDPA